MGIVKCKLCGEDIVWVKLDSGESVACDPKPVRSSHIDGMLVLKPHNCHATQNKVIEISQAMKPSEAIENIEYARRWMGCESDFSEEALDMAIFALKKLEQDRWTPCKERLPEEYGKYRITWKTSCSKKRLIADAEYEPENKYDAVNREFIGKWLLEDNIRYYPDVEVIAWKPLEEPYEAEKES